MINQVILSGNVCNDPDVKTFQDGGSIASFSLATTEKGYTTKSGTQVQDRTDFHRIVLKGNLTKTVPYIRKGDKINIVGKLTYRKYNDQSGTERQITEIIATDVDFCTKHPTDGTATAAPQQPQYQQQGYQQQPPQGQYQQPYQPQQGYQPQPPNDNDNLPF